MTGSASRGAAQLRLLADDLTGALDSAAAFAALGLDVPVGLGAPVPGGGVPDGGSAAGLSVVAVATDTRDLPPSELPARLAPVQDWLAGGEPAFKKVDSLLRGNTIAECVLLARAGGFDGIVFAPAFPRQHRITWQGRQQLRPAAAADPRATPPDPAAHPVGPPLADAFAALGWEARISAADDPPPEAASPGDPTPRSPVWIPDVLDDAALLQVARWALSRGEGPDRRAPAETGAARPERWLCCGSAGLAQALATLLAAAVPAPKAGPVQDTTAVSAGAGHLMLGASHHPVTRAQWVRARAAWPTARVVQAGDEAALADACRALAGPFDRALLELAPRQTLRADAARALLERQLAAIVGSARRPGTVFVVGGDTLLALCRAASVQQLRALTGRRPGWGRARLVGGPWDGVVVHTRSGAFGDEDDLAAMLRAATAT